MEVASLLNYRVERTVIINDITQDNNKVLGDESNKTVKFQRLKRSMEEAVSTFQSVVDEERLNRKPQKKRTLVENEKPIRRSNQEQRMDKSIKRQKGVEGQPISLGVDAGSKTCGENPYKRELYAQRRKSTGLNYHPPTRKQSFQRNLTMAWNGCSKTMGVP